MPQSAIFRHEGDEHVVFSPAADVAAGQPVQISTGYWGVSPIPVKAGKIADFRVRGVFRCIKQSPANVMNVGDLLTYVGPGFDLGSGPWRVRDTSPANQLWVDAEINPTGIAGTGGGGPSEPHTHPISDIVNLQSTLDSKALSTHTHVIGDVTGLQAAIDAKAAAVHTHAIGDVTGLQAALDAKAATVHVHAIADVTGLQAALDGKAAATHTHAIADVTGLQASLDSKSAVGHVHSAADITSGTFPLARLAPMSGIRKVIGSGAGGATTVELTLGNSFEVTGNVIELAGTEELPANLARYRGTYNPATNTTVPEDGSGSVALADGTGTNGDYWIVSPPPATDQSRNFGAGAQTFAADKGGQLVYSGLNARWLLYPWVTNLPAGIELPDNMALYLGTYAPATNTTDPVGQTISDGTGVEGQFFNIVPIPANHSNATEGRNFGSGAISFRRQVGGMLIHNGTVWKYYPAMADVSEPVMMPNSGGGSPTDPLNPTDTDALNYASSQNLVGPTLVTYNDTGGTGTTSNPQYAWWVNPYRNLVRRIKAPVTIPSSGNTYATINRTAHGLSTVGQPICVYSAFDDENWDHIQTGVITSFTANSITYAKAGDTLLIPTTLFQTVALGTYDPATHGHFCYWDLSALKWREAPMGYPTDPSLTPGIMINHLSGGNYDCLVLPPYGVS